MHLSMATAISLPRAAAPLITTSARNPRRLVDASAARASPLRRGRHVVLRSLTVPAAAGASPGLAPDTGAQAWDALGGVSVLAAGTGDAVALTDLWDSTEVLSSSVWTYASHWSQRSAIDFAFRVVLSSYADGRLARAGGGRGCAAEAFRVLLLVSCGDRSRRFLVRSSLVAIGCCSIACN